MKAVLLVTEQARDGHADAGRLQVEGAVGQNAVGSAAVFIPVMVDHDPAAGVDDQVVAQRGQAEIVGQFQAGVDLVRAGGEDLDQDDGVGDLDRVGVEAVAAADQGVGLVDRVVVDADRLPSVKAWQGRPRSRIAWRRAMTAASLPSLWLARSGDMATISPATSS